MQKHLISLTQPINALTSLQKCINKLESIVVGISGESRLASELTQIVQILKRGNLHRAEVQVPSELTSLALRSRLKEYSETDEAYCLSPELPRSSTLE